MYIIEHCCRRLTINNFLNIKYIRHYNSISFLTRCERYFKNFRKLRQDENLSSNTVGVILTTWVIFDEYYQPFQLHSDFDKTPLFRLDWG